MRSETFKSVVVKGWGQRTNPKTVRIYFGSSRVRLPEQTAESVSDLERVIETEIIFDRENFMQFAEKIAELKKWLEERPPSNSDMVQQEFTADEHLAEWLKD